MVFASAPEIGHIYDPVSDETITHPDGGVEVIITNRTIWVALCDDKIRITNEAYKALFDDSFDLRKECPNCKNTAMEIDPDGDIFDF